MLLWSKVNYLETQPSKGTIITRETKSEGQQPAVTKKKGER
jgi:hypothetical protein